MYRIDNINLPVNYQKSDLVSLVSKSLSTPSKNIKNIITIKKSIDARKKSSVRFVMSVAVDVFDGEGISARPYLPPKTSIKELGLERISTDKKIYIVGSGPAGLFTALTLSSFGIKSTILERGDDLETRIKKVENLKENGILDTETNVQFGEGGAGTFSDGKLGSGISNEFFGILYGEFVKFGAPEDIMSESAPHIGTDVLRKVLKNIHLELNRRGVNFRTKSKLTDIKVVDGKVKEIEVDGTEILPCDYLILAIGHSAEDTFRMLESRGVDMVPKPFSIGVRVEHRQDLISDSQYGKFSAFLPPADYKLSHHLESGRGVYTFCMCPGGEVVCSSDLEGTVVTNGMSERARDGKFANSALLVSVTPEDYPKGPFGGFEFRKKYEKLAYEEGGGGYFAPAQRVVDFLKGVESKGEILSSYRPGVHPTDLSKVLPDFVIDGIKEGLTEFGKKIKGFDREGTLIGVETRSSCPVRLQRSETRESNIKGIFPCGEGSGYAGGITSSAIDGIKTALSIYDILK